MLKRSVVTGSMATKECRMVAATESRRGAPRSSPTRSTGTPGGHDASAPGHSVRTGGGGGVAMGDGIVELAVRVGIVPEPWRSRGGGGADGVGDRGRVLYVDRFPCDSVPTICSDLTSISVT